MSLNQLPPAWSAALLSPNFGFWSAWFRRRLLAPSSEVAHIDRRPNHALSPVEKAKVGLFDLRFLYATRTFDYYATKVSGEPVVFRKGGRGLREVNFNRLPYYERETIEHFL